MNDFEEAYRNNIFENAESRSGPGSTLQQTAQLRSILPPLLHSLKITTLLDAPCGDFNWMSHVDLSPIKYTGVDVVPSVIATNTETYTLNKVDGSPNSTPTPTFQTLNLITDPLPKADLILCRDCLVHMTLEDAMKVIQNFKRSGAKYLLSTTFSECEENTDELIQGRWRPLNLTKPPFGFPEPMRLVNEGCTEVNLGMSFPDKCLGLWELEF